MKKTIAGKSGMYEVDYDPKKIEEVLVDLGIGPEKSVRYASAVIVAYTVTRKIKSAYEVVSVDAGVTPTCIAAHIRRGLENAVYNGRLKNVDDYFGVAFYDYENGFATKEFVAVMSLYMTSYGIITLRPCPLTA